MPRDEQTTSHALLEGSRQDSTRRQLQHGNTTVSRGTWWMAARTERQLRRCRQVGRGALCEARQRVESAAARQAASGWEAAALRAPSEPQLGTTHAAGPTAVRSDRRLILHRVRGAVLCACDDAIKRQVSMLRGRGHHPRSPSDTHSAQHPHTPWWGHTARVRTRVRRSGATYRPPSRQPATRTVGSTACRARQ